MLSAGDRAILDATAADLAETAPILAAFLAEGPQMLRIRGVEPKVIDDLVPGWERPPLRRRMSRRVRGWLRPHT